jgi:hypothetical protein
MKKLKNGCYADENGGFSGVDPRGLSEEQLNDLGHKKMPLRKIIREKCLDCTCNQIVEIAKCPVVSCPLWPYRMNSNPFNTREMSDEQKECIANRLKGAREKK